MTQRQFHKSIVRYWTEKAELTSGKVRRMCLRKAQEHRDILASLDIEEPYSAPRGGVR
jgi:hypothetical protein